MLPEAEHERWMQSKLDDGWVNGQGEEAAQVPGCPGQAALGSEIPCPNCGKPIKLNPFTIQGDWKPIAETWQKKEIRDDIINHGGVL